MTIVVVLIGLLISHSAPGVRRMRSFSWLLWPVREALERPNQPSWLPCAAVLATALLVSTLVMGLAEFMLGIVGWMLLALAGLVYSLGPRDLDRDVEILLAGEDPSEIKEIRAVMRLPESASAPAAAAAVYHASLARWFGVLFWFVILGVPGAVLYRLNRSALHLAGLQAAQRAWLVRLRRVLDWPVLALMVLSAGLCADLDRVLRVWRQSKNRGAPPWGLSASFLDRLAMALVAGDGAFKDGLSSGHRLVWRMLMLWLVALSLLLLAGWLA